jgi:hypothetical protein
LLRIHCTQTAFPQTKRSLKQSHHLRSNRYDSTDQVHLPPSRIAASETTRLPWCIISQIVFFYSRYILCQIHITSERRAVTSCLRVSTIREKWQRAKNHLGRSCQIHIHNPQRPLSLGRWESKKKRRADTSSLNYNSNLARPQHRYSPFNSRKIMN